MNLNKDWYVRNLSNDNDDPCVVMSAGMIAQHKQDVRLSRRMCCALRHQPSNFGITLDNHGYTDLELFAKSMKSTVGDIERVVTTCDKQRYTILDGKIKANQGHSIKGIIAFDHMAIKPPDVLFHGTTEERFSKINIEGIKSMNRHHVHLSIDKKTAKQVAIRHKKETPIVLPINSQKMHKDGFVFYLSDNGVYLTHIVPPEYIGID